MIQKKSKSIISNYSKAIMWLKNNSEHYGVSVSSKQKNPYPEVSGYLIPTLLEAGESNLAYQYATFLKKNQKKNGAFLGPDGKEYIFDTGQALKGLLFSQNHWPEFKAPARKAANYMLRSQEKNGRFISTYYDNIPEKVFVYCLPTLIEASKILKNNNYKTAALKALNYYKRLADILEFDCLSHFYAYLIDGLIDMGEQIFVQKSVEKIFNLQKKNGAIPAYNNSSWSCSVGTAQFAVIGYKLGLVEKADKALDWLCKVQKKSGGFDGSYGFGADYFLHEEISWTNKFFLDAIHEKIRVFFDNYADAEFEKIKNSDPRLKKILRFGGNLSNKKILDAGCGDGRFAKKILKKFPSAKIYCLELSEKMLSKAPKELIKKQGSILNIPYKKGFFDFVYTVETLEHSLQWENAVSELCRVTKENGKIIIIDKNIDCQGSLEITEFEQWFNTNLVKFRLEENHIEVKSQFIQSKKWPKNLFITWVGFKKKYTTVKLWNKIISETSLKKIINKIKYGQFPTWIQPLLINTVPNDSMLELGSGTGELSAILASQNRKANLLDFSEKCIGFSKKLFKSLGLKANFYNENVLNKLSFKNHSIDWVFSSGLLEHFDDDEIAEIMKESARIARKGVITLVPNANSLFYQIGKFQMEKNGQWPYGYDAPKFSMKKFFLKSGLKKIQEYSIDPYHALNFHNYPAYIKDYFDSLNEKEIKKLNQGYLLFTCGKKENEIK